jgi:hypothetical protein
VKRQSAFTAQALQITLERGFMTITVGEQSAAGVRFNTSKPYQAFEEIESFIVAFEARTLPKPCWTHQAHLIVALWYNLRHRADEALDLVRENIKRYNEAVGTLNTETSGYHESITVFYMWAVRQFIVDAGPEASLVELANRLISGKCAARSFPFEYYSRELLLSTEARLRRVEADVKAMKCER